MSMSLRRRIQSLVTLLVVAAAAAKQIPLETSSLSRFRAPGGEIHDDPDPMPQDSLRAAWAGSARADTSFPLLHIHFCSGCPDPAVEGSLGESSSAIDDVLSV